MEQMVFTDPAPSELDELVKEIDEQLDASFLGDLEVALERARAASDPEAA
ncbi:MAG TPA: hypothetical protein VLU43_17810 [Anaeromyxobacteraceae bacterium]|nr:hypothetical protein [Anaeromyxobacteraceae bacterium]